MQASVYIATSLDGFIARTDGSVDWLMSADASETSEDYGFHDFLNSIDCMIMGRKTMDFVLNFNEWIYEGKRVIVFSSTLQETPSALAGKIELYSGSIPELVERLESEGIKRLYVDGGKTIQSFINEGLITDLTITTIPILLGEGIPLFGKTHHDIQLEHISTISYPSGFVKSTYEIK